MSRLHRSIERGHTCLIDIGAFDCQQSRKLDFAINLRRLKLSRFSPFLVMKLSSRFGSTVFEIGPLSLICFSEISGDAVPVVSVCFSMVAKVIQGMRRSTKPEDEKNGSLEEGYLSRFEVLMIHVALIFQKHVQARMPSTSWSSERNAIVM